MSNDCPHRKTASDSVRDVLREEETLEAAQICDAILEGYRDLAKGRTVSYRGNLQKLLKQPGR